MRSRFAAPLLLLAALAAVPAAAQVEGRYEVVSINGQALPTPSPMQRWVTVVRTLYWFEEGRFNTAMTSRGSGEEYTQRAGGRYISERDSLYVVSEPGTDTLARFRWQRQGDTLQLYDRNQNVYALMREAAAAGDPWTPGTWNAVQLNGRDLPAQAPRNPASTVASMTFAFGADGRVTLRMRSTYEGRPRNDAYFYAYRVAGDKLTFMEEDGNVEDEFVWTLRDGRLRLVDWYGHVYYLEPAATAP